ncbi:hypothetical protein [Ilumatobacter coccineus]|uniref:Uncharacterized protein n=1 Tax=Ilumatobacter coccineus (strain NBRC 103263 / KCTC 29153 / YM16-304) TaxID=1313172 RepID=A0A6C7EA66_ILUCY|nr:hypothetical protein [Ilumatobacter coccineus]BAN03351.1 hypothetical protein YM304_30370 [Ilumatobacter coccineus YM16-304]
MSTDDNEADLIAARKRLAEQDAKIEKLRSEIRLDGFLNSHRYASDQHQQNQQPLLPVFDHPGYVAELAKSMPEHAWRWLQHHEMPPTVDQLCASFSEEVRHTVESLRPVLATALDDPDVPIHLENYAGDFYVEVADDEHTQQRMADAFDRYENRDDALIAAHDYMRLGDPDPFGLIEEAEAQR